MWGSGKKRIELQSAYVDVWAINSTRTFPTLKHKTVDVSVDVDMRNNDKPNDAIIFSRKKSRQFIKLHMFCSLHVCWLLFTACKICVKTAHYSKFNHHYSLWLHRLASLLSCHQDSAFNATVNNNLIPRKFDVRSSFFRIG